MRRAPSVLVALVRWRGWVRVHVHTNSALRDHFGSVLGASARELFAPFGLPLEETPPRAPRPTPEGDVFAGFLGFAGQHLRGTVVLLTTREVLLAAVPAQLGIASDYELCDWVGELANQLVGRTQNKLASSGVAMRVSSPTAIRGVSIALPAGGRGPRSSWTFASSAGEVLVVADVEVLSVPLLSEVPPRGEPASEGDLLLF